MSYPIASSVASAAATIATSAATNGTGPATGGEKEEHGSNQRLMVRVNLFIFACMAVWILVRLPRALALLRTPSEWSRGHLLLRRRASLITSISSREHLTSTSTKKYPPHIGTCAKPFRLFLLPLRSRVLPGVSGGQVVIVVVYCYLMGYAAWYDSNIFTDEERTGWIAVTQMPLLFALAQKSNFLSTLLGQGYEKLNFLHRMVGLVCILMGNLHAFIFLYKGNILTMIKRPSNMWGFIAIICFDVIWITSWAVFRTKFYNIFKFAHVAGFALALPACYLHKPAMVPYIYCCLIIYGLDRVTRLVKTRTQSAFIQQVPELNAVRLEIPSLNAGWRAGQHVRIRVLSMGMGIMGWSEIHPFTIASASDSPNGVVLLVKQAGDWTKALYMLAGPTGRYGREDNLSEKSPVRQVTVMVEGPYGGPCHTIASSFSGAVFLVGGSGITFATAMISDLIQKEMEGESRLKSIDLVWSVQSPSSLLPFLADLTKFIQQSTFVPIRVSVHYTRAPSKREPFLSEKEQIDTFPQGMTLAAGRPRLDQVLNNAISRTIRSVGRGKPSGLVVGVCGPLALADEMVTAVNGVNSQMRDDIGGIEIIEEVFGW